MTGGNVMVAGRSTSWRPFRGVTLKDTEATPGCFKLLWDDVKKEAGLGAGPILEKTP